MVEGGYLGTYRTEFTGNQGIVQHDGSQCAAEYLITPFNGRQCNQTQTKAFGTMCRALSILVSHVISRVTCLLISGVLQRLDGRYLACFICCGMV